MESLEEALRKIRLQKVKKAKARKQKTIEKKNERTNKRKLVDFEPVVEIIPPTELEMIKEEIEVQQAVEAKKNEPVPMDILEPEKINEIEEEEPTPEVEEITKKIEELTTEPLTWERVRKKIKLEKRTITYNEWAELTGGPSFEEQIEAIEKRDREEWSAVLKKNGIKTNADGFIC